MNSVEEAKFLDLWRLTLQALLTPELILGGSYKDEARRNEVVRTLSKLRREPHYRILTLPLVLPWYSLQISLTLVAQVLVMVEVSPKLLRDRDKQNEL